MTDDDIKQFSKESFGIPLRAWEAAAVPFTPGMIQKIVGHAVDAAQAAERQAIADICDELEGHWSDYKDAALLNDDVALSNAASGEPRAARAIKEAVLARNGTQVEWRPKG